MTRTFLNVKTWFIEREQEKATKYNLFIDIENRDENGFINHENEFQKVIAEVISESEKAIQVILNTGSVVGSAKGWKTWIPKSVIKN
ncbi:MAG: hypothetical protein J6S67_25570 [Methanobrevibacter sp.]|nr:hypothetical protein [Methanobrevibacter sp.]